MADPTELERFTERLAKPLTESEVAARADELARILVRIDDRVENRRMIAKELQGEIDGMRSDASELARSVRERAVYGDVECVRQFNPDTSLVETVRLDTGEVVSSRTPTGAERQISLLPFDPPKDEDAGAADSS